MPLPGVHLCCHWPVCFPASNLQTVAEVSGAGHANVASDRGVRHRRGPML